MTAGKFESITTRRSRTKLKKKPLLTQKPLWESDRFASGWWLLPSAFVGALFWWVLLKLLF